MDKPITADFLLNVDETRLMEKMDLVQPDWWYRHASQQDLWVFVDESKNIIDHGRARHHLRLVTLRRMRDAVWLMGHSALSINFGVEDEAPTR